MNRYNWKGYDFIGTVPEFAEKFGYCKTPTFLRARLSPTLGMAPVKVNVKYPSVTFPP